MEKLDEAFSNEDHVTIVSLKSLYPQGAEKSIIYATCGIVLPRGKTSGRLRRSCYERFFSRTILAAT